MSKFKKIGTSKTIRNKKLIIKIEKFQKEGTRRIFFAPEIAGLRLTHTMFSKMYDAEKLALNYIKIKNSQS